jgi:mRNA-degrading endonuclease RelE of RelBE toxin-antitoxin system
MRILLSPRFSKQVKKLHPTEKKILDKHVLKVSESPNIGAPQVGELTGSFIYKFKIKEKQWLMAYEIESKNSITLLMLGAHENFYRDLKK